MKIFPQIVIYSWKYIFKNELLVQKKKRLISHLLIKTNHKYLFLIKNSWSILQAFINNFTIHF